MARRRKPASGNQGQPVRDIPATRHGQAAQLEAIQGSAPLQGPTPPVPTGAPAAAAPRGAPVSGPQAFRATERPGEAITAGIPFGPGNSGQNAIIPTDSVDSFLRALYSVLPDDAILRLIKE